MGWVNIIFKKTLPVQIWKFFVQRFFGFGVFASSKENADLARRRRIWRFFPVTKSTIKNRERDLVYHICDGSSVIIGVEHRKQIGIFW